MKPILVEVIAPVLIVDIFPRYGASFLLGAAGLSQRLLDAAFDDYPLDFLDDFQRLWHWLTELIKKYGRRIQVKVIDPKSFTGLYKSLRYRVRQYPTFIVEGRAKHVGWDKEELDRLLQARVAGV